MKRLLCSVLCFVLIVSIFPCAFAEETFTLRNGIQFGDTMDDILEKETTLIRESDTSNSFKGKVAGYSGVECTFAFDDDGKLVSMHYHFPSEVCTSRDTMSDIYKTIYQSMKRQYGNPLGNTGGSCHLITGPAIMSMSIYVYLFGTLDGYNGDYTDYDEWIVDTDQYHVKIDLISYYYRDDSYDYYYMVDASYKMYTDAEYEEALKEKQGEREETDNDF